MHTVDFSDDLWLFLSPWGRHLEDARYFDAIALAWVSLWNYTIDRTSVPKSQVQEVCKGLFDLPTNKLIEILLERRAVFFPDDNRLIEGYQVGINSEELVIYVTFVEPD